VLVKGSRLLVAYLLLFEAPICVVATWCGLDGAHGSAETLLLFSVFVTASLWPVLSGSHARRSVAAGPR
jgi:hypothetical protein